MAAVVGLASAVGARCRAGAGAGAGGLCFALGLIDVALIVLALGLIAVLLPSPERRGWAVAGFRYAAAALIASMLLRLDPARALRR